jgi:hypothetical protein
MENHGASEEEVFGKEIGLVHEAIITGRKVGVGREFWKALAHNQWLFKRVSDLVKSEENKYLALAEWARFYKEVFKIEADFSDISIPEKKERFKWLIVMLKGLTPDELCVRAGCWLRLNLGELESIRKPIETYAVWLRVEADEQIENIVADDCVGEGISGITLEERLLFDIFYHWRTGKHPNFKIIYPCRGSQVLEGHTPCVYRDGEKLYVDPNYPAHFKYIFSVHAGFIVSA